MKISFFVIGAQKAGTTTLHQWLSACPQIALPDIKETHFFSDEERSRLGWKWYQSHFPHKAAKTIYGEVDPDYLFHAEAARRIHESVENPRLIIILREPLARAYSQYLMTKRRGYENLTFPEALDAENNRCTEEGQFALDHYSYLSRSLYSEQIRIYRDLFPNAPFFFVKFEDLFSEEGRTKMMCELFKFIGADFTPHESDLSGKLNLSSEPRSLFLRDLIYRASPLKKMLGRLIPSADLKMKLILLADRLNSRPSRKKEPLPEDKVSKAIREKIVKDLMKLPQLTGLNFDEWILKHQSYLSRQTS